MEEEKGEEEGGGGSDHMNQLEVQCLECNPNDYENW